jgi:hypothetical protein
LEGYRDQDSEGLGNILGRGLIIDAKIAILLAALSNLLLFNVKGNILQADMEMLSRALAVRL